MVKNGAESMTILHNYIPFLLLFHTCQRQETNIKSPVGPHMSNSAVYY